MSKLRYLEQDIGNICFQSNKMAFVSGARQCGKTTLAKRMLTQRGNGQYYNWDETKFRRMWTKDPAAIIPVKPEKIKPLIILDEIHKAKLWKRSLKGVYDVLDNKSDIIVTGSARLNVYRKGSDSLLGRYYHFQLHPFSLAELSKNQNDILPDTLLDNLFSRSIQVKKIDQERWHTLLKFGPFPEPLFSANPRTLLLWQRNRVEKIIREDLRDLSRLPELSQIEMLVSLIPERIANPLSIRSLSEDLEVAYSTVKRWLNYLRELYYYYEITPYSRSLSAAIKKEKKIYLWDWSEVDDMAARFENAMASHLLKYCHYINDTGLGESSLHYIRNKYGLEIDFLLVRDKKPWFPVEVKLNQTKPTTNWSYWLPRLPCERAVQVVLKPNIFKKMTIKDKELLIISADEFLLYFV